jgi:hypothetical protein
MDILITLLPVSLVIAQHVVSEIRDARASSPSAPCRW